MKGEVSALSEDFLFELYFAALKYENVCGIVTDHMKPEYLPDRDFQVMHRAIVSYYRANKSGPSYGMLLQQFAANADVSDLIAEVRESNYRGTPDGVIETLEEYVKNVRLQTVYSEVGKLYNKGSQEKARQLLQEYAQWLNGFTLKGGDFVDVMATFEERHTENAKVKEEMQRNNKREITRFYIDAIDELNGGRNLRGQLSCFLSPTGIGKSHIARFVGKQAATLDGLNVMHIQLEGSKKEVTDAYSASLIEQSSYLYEQGRIAAAEMKMIVKRLSGYAGSIKVRSYPRFGLRVSTTDVKNAVAEYRKVTDSNPDIVIIDSLDLLTDSSGMKWDSDHERHRRIAVANDLKDLAADEDVWIVGTYQATVENKDWLNDERNVLSEYNCAEAKGLARPMTHLISLNQSDNEREEEVLRLHIAKSRFFKKGGTFKIATRYGDEVFYDRVRTLNLMKTLR